MSVWGGVGLGGVRGVGLGVWGGCSRQQGTILVAVFGESAQIPFVCVRSNIYIN